MLIYVFIFIVGAAIGSFLNVCIYRLPRQESIVFPGYHCTQCNHRIYWHDNIPLLSFILLGGKCRFCARRISFRYFTVELLTALAFLTMHLFFGFSARFFVFSVLSSALIAVTFIDFEHQIIPDVITIPGIILGIMASLLFPSVQGQVSRLISFVDSSVGVFAGGGSIYAMGVFGRMLFKKEAMGGGDVKLMAMIGAFLGWRLVIFVFFIAPFFGSTAGIFEKIVHKKDIIPYGPYISMATIIGMLWGERLLGYLFF